MQLGVGIAIGVVNVAVVIGNLIVLYALISQKSLRTPTNRIVLSLTCADGLLGIVILPFSLLQETLNKWVAGELWCRMWLALDVWFSTTSIYHLLAISFDRFMAVRQPIRYPTISSKKVIRLMIFLCWFLSFPLALGLFIYESAHNSEQVRVTCTPMTLPEFYIIFSSSCSFLVPAIIMVVLNAFIFRTVLSSSRSKNLSSKSTGATMRIHRGTTKHAPGDEPKHVSSVTRSKVSIEEDSGKEKEEKSLERSPPSTVKTSNAVSIENVDVTTLNNNNVVPDKSTIPDRPCHMNGTAVVTDANGATSLKKRDRTSSSIDRHTRFSVATIDSYDDGRKDSVATFGEKRPDEKLGSGKHPHTFFNHVMVVSLISTKRKKSEIMRHLSHERKKARTMRTELRVARTTSVVVAAFIIMWFPFMTIYLLQAYKICEMQTCLSDAVFTWAFWLGYANSAVNPLLYAACSRDVRAAIRKVFCGRRRPAHA